MQRIHSVVHTATPYLVLAILGGFSLQRVLESTQPESPSRNRVTAVRSAEQLRVVHVHESAPAPSHADPTRPPAAPIDEPDDVLDEDVDEEELEWREEQLERGHGLVDGMLDRGVADPQAASEFRDIVSALPHAQRIELYARLMTAINRDELEVDPDHLPI